jgi:hypothetical protein
MGNQKCNTAYTRRRQTKQMHKAINIGHHYTQRNTNNVNKTWALLQTIGGKDELNILFYAKFITDITTPNSERKDTNKLYKV